MLSAAVLTDCDFQILIEELSLPRIPMPSGLSQGNKYERAGGDQGDAPYTFSIILSADLAERSVCLFAVRSSVMFVSAYENRGTMSQLILLISQSVLSHLTSGFQQSTQMESQSGC